jgi:serine/threonine protein kinase
MFKDMNIGSPFYMSPEAFLDNVYGRKTDVWSFGIILYELLHGKTPFSDFNDHELLKAKITVPIKL